jgi:hypothetical protein
MGYDQEVAKLSLQAFGSNIQKSMEFFMSNQNAKSVEELQKELLKLIKNDQVASAATTSIEEIMKAKKAKELINNDVPEDDEEYLDFNLDEDSLFINKYYSLLSI